MDNNQTLVIQNRLTILGTAYLLLCSCTFLLWEPSALIRCCYVYPLVQRGSSPLRIWCDFSFYLCDAIDSVFRSCNMLYAVECACACGQGVWKHHAAYRKRWDDGAWPGRMAGCVCYAGFWERQTHHSGPYLKATNRHLAGVRSLQVS